MKQANVIHIQAHITIFGFVQGVGFRHLIRSKAIELGLTGWVRNNPEGSVETLFQGSKEKIEQIIKLCKKGPFLSEVENVDVQWENEKEKFDSFEVI